MNQGQACTSRASIKYVGFDRLEMQDSELEKIQVLSIKYMEKICSHIKQITEFVLHIKHIPSNGKKHQYVVKARIVYPGSIITAGSVGWKIVSAVHKALDGLDEECRQRFRHLEKHLPKTIEFYDTTRDVTK